MRGRQPAAPDTRTGALTDLTAALWDVRDAMELLQFRLVTCELLPEAIDVLDHREATRSERAEGAALALGAGPHATLADLSAVVSEPWAWVLGEHRAALRLLMRDVHRRARSVTWLHDRELARFVA